MPIAPPEFRRVMLLGLGLWLLFVATLAIIFRNWRVFEIYLFPSFVFVYIIWNESRLDRRGTVLGPLSPGMKIHFFFSIPGLLILRAILAIPKALKDPIAPWLLLSLSFGLAWAVLLLYFGAILVRKRAAQKMGIYKTEIK